ncbi:hypothetical protein FVR03_24175 [Pontibacter qinzhouensis]|jgi:hypothetical protein|uniref:Uncharacterized protein n=1 Tax=Pontibacter qinzhouensis TaxID=2603253 RepID=A0A5C8IDY1_9BACT|nr:hypothetical protein [Pontibacter qinzhouensis]TXK17854.1 hypothetical protein FVR03_24175 [Pontibacter qinzhouensis]
MIFSGVDSQTVELKITNYQFPDNQEGDWDGNWLNIYLKVDSKVGKWQTIDPSLTTWEVQEIIDWFDQLSADKEPEFRLMTFTEPNLSFELLNEPIENNKLIRIKFDLECRPKSATDDKEYFVDISADRDELIAIKKGLKDELNKYPERKPTA